MTAVLVGVMVGCVLPAAETTVSAAATEPTRSVLVEASAGSAPPWPAVDQVTGPVAAYLDAETRRLGLPGAAVSVIVGGDVVWTHATGTADPAGEPMTADTPVLLASTSKAITAIAVAQLVQDGRLDLTEPVSEYLRWFTPTTPGPPMTVGDLLHHTAGLDLGHDAGTHLADGGPHPLQDRVRDLAEDDIAVAPGEYSYSNASYDVLGLLVAETSGRPFGAYVAEHVLAPLGMDHAYTSAETARADGLAEGYYRWFGRWWRAADMPAPGGSRPSATMYGSASDLGRLVAAHLTRPANVLPPAGWDLLTAPEALIAPDVFYAGGLVVRPQWELADPSGTSPDTSALPTVYEHNGSWPNSHTFLAFVPEQDRGVALVVNGNDQARESALVGLDHNLLRLLAGHDAVHVPVTDEPLQRYGWAIAAVFLGLELVSLGWSVRRLRARPAGPSGVRSRTSLLRTALPPLVLDAVVVWLVLAYIPARFFTTPAELIRLNPDLGVLIVPGLALALVWGPLRTVLLLRIHGAGQVSPPQAREEGAVTAA
ncbi:serine hydrolase domain-containing protein [Georgenia subflava]|uniref:serine hydrolase domain-containing protein n=1 Tax=Georgenia subflava TaxID=1622177 RepID=UPI00186ACBF8|nr:serine hydrolase domain-containing protein [Georgenia subflava]